jgi:pyruvate,orthophosphate dikinase
MMVSHSDGSATGVAVFPFDFEHGGSHHDVARVVGGKGASLWAMSRLGIPTPPGFTIGTSECERFLRCGMSDDLRRAVRVHVAGIEALLGRRFGDSHETTIERTLKDSGVPLLLSVRSGAAVSMPGMMDTVLNVGLTPGTVDALARESGDQSFAYDTYLRFLRMFAKTVLGLDLADETGPVSEERCRALHAEVVARTGPRFDDPFEQLEMCIDAVFRSWNSPRAIVYRDRQHLSGAAGTAVNVQAMVFGNLDRRSATGVVFTRDPSTGEATPRGDLLYCAQGEDVVAGTHRTRPISDLQAGEPRLYDELCDVMNRLELYYRDMCDIEFTIERGKLWILQARAGKRSPQAAARVAVELVSDPRFGLSHADAVAMVPNEVLAGEASAAACRAASQRPALACGIGASPGVASGVAVLDPDRAVERADAGDTVILVRRETSPSDLHGMSVAAGILTAAGGQMSHAAVVAREWGIPAVCGVAGLDVRADSFAIGAMLLREGDTLSIDGTTGNVFLGTLETVTSDEGEQVATLRRWAAEIAAPS